MRVRPEYDAGAERLTLHFPDGSSASGDAVGDESAVGDFWGRPVPGHLVAVELSQALSEYVGRHLRLVRAAQAGIGTDSLHPVSLVGDGSVAELARRLGQADLDRRRFRMLLELRGVEAHAEDDWEGSLLQVGDAVVRLGGPVGRCANITYDPQTGIRDVDALRAIREYRGTFDGEVCFGVYADVVEPGRVRVGDAVAPV